MVESKRQVSLKIRILISIGIVKQLQKLFLTIACREILAILTNSNLEILCLLAISRSHLLSELLLTPSGCEG